MGEGEGYASQPLVLALFPMPRPSLSCCCSSCGVDVPPEHLTKIWVFGWICRYCLGKLIRVWPKKWIGQEDSSAS